MKRTTVFVDEGLESDLRALADRQGRPLAAVVREAMERYVAQETRGPRLRLGFLAAGRSGRTDTAERHEDLLFRPRVSRRPARGRRRRP